MEAKFGSLKTQELQKQMEDTQLIDEKLDFKLFFCFFTKTMCVLPAELIFLVK